MGDLVLAAAAFAGKPNQVNLRRLRAALEEIDAAARRTMQCKLETKRAIARRRGESEEENC